MNKWKRDPKYAAFVKANHAFVWLPGLDDFMEKIYELRAEHKRLITLEKAKGTPEASKNASLLRVDIRKLDDMAKSLANFAWWSGSRADILFWGFQKSHVRPKIPNHQCRQCIEKIWC